MNNNNPTQQDYLNFLNQLTSRQLVLTISTTKGIDLTKVIIDCFFQMTNDK